MIAAVGDDAIVGRVIANKFRVERLLGAGAMGRVYQAQQLSLGKPVAIKVLNEKLVGDAALERRFEREARSASALMHPNIVQVIDFGRDDALLWLAMELLPGRNLHQLLKADGPFPPTRIAHVVGQVLSALEEAHAKDIVHRDLKPENVIVADVRGEPDFVKVCDFGIAKAVSARESGTSALTSAGMVCGTPEYLSPEQARGEALDGRSDLYSVACMLYQLACGELPFSAETAFGLVTLHLHERPLPPSQRPRGADIPEALEAVILRGLAKQREGRFSSAALMREALYAAVGMKRPGSGLSLPSAAAAPTQEMALAATGLNTPATPMPPQSGSVHGELKAAPKPRRRELIAALLGSSALFAVALISFIVTRGSPSTPPSPPVAKPSAVAAPATPSSLPSPPSIETTPSPPSPAPASTPPKKEPHKKGHLAASEPVKPAAPASAPTTAPAPAPPAAPVGFAALFAEAETLFKAGSVEAALQKYLEAARLNGGDARTQRQIGKCYNRLGQRERAQPYLKRYLELSPDASDAAFIRAMIDGQ